VKNSKTIFALVLATFLSASFTSVFANETKWDKEHPRRDEVNDRLANQNKRIHKEVKEGEMSKGEAAKLHQQDRNIRQEEHDMAKQNGGHLNQSKQKVLNQQENSVSKEIGK
jgi:hypothetical protein